MWVVVVQAAYFCGKRAYLYFSGGFLLTELAAISQGADA